MTAAATAAVTVVTEQLPVQLVIRLMGAIESVVAGALAALEALGTLIYRNGSWVGTTRQPILVQQCFAAFEFLHAVSVDLFERLRGMQRAPVITRSGAEFVGRVRAFMQRIDPLLPALGAEGRAALSGV